LSRGVHPAFGFVWSNDRASACTVKRARYGTELL
jgi:hypothetical protein